MDINVQQQLKDLKDEIDVANADIKDKEAEWKNATTAEDKAFHAQSIQDLREKEKTLIASRDRLIAASISSQGKDISMAVSPAKLCSRYMRTVVIRLVCSNVTASPSPSTCIGVLENDYDDNGGYIIT